MKCDGCGQQFSAHEARHDTRTEVGPYRLLRPYKTVLMTLCPECAKSRRGVFWFLLWTIAGIIAVLAVVTSVLGWSIDLINFWK